MRFFHLPTLGVVLSVGMVGASVVCNTKRSPGINDTDISISITGQIADMAKTCIENVCNSATDTGADTEHCGPIFLAVTYHNDPLVNFENCVGQFRSIITQCSGDGVYGGISHVGKTIYDIAVVDDSDDDQGVWFDDEERDEESKRAGDIEHGDGKDVADDDGHKEGNDWLEQRGIVEHDEEDEAHEKLAEPDVVEDDEEVDVSEEHDVEMGKRHFIKNDAGYGGNSERPKKTTPNKKTPKKTTLKKYTPKKTTPKNKPKTKQTKNPKSCPVKEKPGQTGKGNAEKGKKTSRDVIDAYLPRGINEIIFPRGIFHSKQGGGNGGKKKHSGKSSGRTGKAGSSKKDKGKQKASGGTPATAGNAGSSSKGKGKASGDRTASTGNAGSSSKGKKDGGAEKWYEETPLLRKTATWWRFNSVDGWGCKIPAQQREYKVLEKMKPTIKFDVIEVKSGNLQIVGNPTDGSPPEDFASKRGNYLLTNAGFFTMDKTHRSVGPTSSTRKMVPIPPEYKEYYEKVTGEDGSYLWSGPSLTRNLDLLNGDEFNFFDPNYSNMYGSLAHAGQPNERLVLVKLKNGDKYMFVYTADKPRRSESKGGGIHPGNGQTINEMRELILFWFVQFKPEVRASSMTQFVNLDGGGSLYVSWNERGKRERKIARGSIEDETPHGVIKNHKEEVIDIRTPTNLIKISA